MPLRPVSLSTWAPQLPQVSRQVAQAVPVRRVPLPAPARLAAVREQRAGTREAQRFDLRTDNMNLKQLCETCGYTVRVSEILPYETRAKDGAIKRTDHIVDKRNRLIWMSKAAFDALKEATA